MAETIRIEVVDMNSGGAATASSAGVSTSSGGASAGGTANVGGWAGDAAGNNFASMLNVLQRIEVLLSKGRGGRGRGGNGGMGDGSLEGRGWAHYLNQQMPMASFGINNMYAKQEQRVGWATSLMGLPDRMERALMRAQDKAWGKDPNAFDQLQKVTQDYRFFKFQSMVEQAGNIISKFAQWSFKSYTGIANDTVQMGNNIKTAGQVLGTFVATVNKKAGAAITVLSQLAGTYVEIVGFAQGKLHEEARRVEGWSPELRMQGIVSNMREMRTDQQIASQFGAQMARQEDQNSRRESAWRILQTKTAAAIAKPFEQVNEAMTSTVEALAGQRAVGDALINGLAALPAIGGFFKGEADRRNAEFKERQNMKDIENGKQLCEAILGNLILPGEVGLGPQNGRPEKPKKKMHEAIFNAGGE